MFVFGNFGVLCFLETPVLRFALLPYYRQKEFFTFTFGKDHSASRHYQFMVIRYSRLYSARFHKKGSHI